MKPSAMVGAVGAMLLLGCGRSALEEPLEPSIQCGEGTHLEGGRCFANTKGLACGVGTLEQAGVCVAQLDCGAGTLQQGTHCIPASTITCGPGTSEQSGVCVPDVGCGPGTIQSGRICVPISELSCGPGTVAAGNQCIAPPPVVCGAGTTLVGDTCMPDLGWYEVRVAGSTVFTDGTSSLPVLALGRLPNGSPATGSILLSVEPPTAGILQMPTLSLTTVGATTDFTACASANNPTCAGTARIRLALASAPNQVVAESQPVTLLAPPALGVTAACDVLPRALVLEGTGWIFSGRKAFTSGFWVDFLTPAGDDFWLSYDQRDAMTGFVFEIATPRGSGPLQETVYALAERIPFQSAGHPGLTLTSAGRGCNTSLGTFQVHRLSVVNGEVSRLLVTFEHSCNNDPANMVRGCVSFTR